MKASLALNDKDQFALFYDELLPAMPEWASIDIGQGEIHIGCEEDKNCSIKLDKIDERIYARVANEKQVLLILVKPDGAREPLHAVFVPLMVPQQI